MLFDELMQSIAVGYPPYETRVLTQWDDWVPPDTQIFFISLRVNGKQGVDKAEKLHDSLILSDIFMALQEEHVFATITTIDLHLSWMLFGRKDRKYTCELLNFDYFPV